ncbi:MAG: hypothetical protein ACOX33_06665 [Dethiobacteria bacterium]
MKDKGRQQLIFFSEDARHIHRHGPFLSAGLQAALRFFFRQVSRAQRQLRLCIARPGFLQTGLTSCRPALHRQAGPGPESV